MNQHRPCRPRPALFGGHVAVAVLALSALNGLPLAVAPGLGAAPTLAVAGPQATRRMPAQRRSFPQMVDGAVG